MKISEDRGSYGTESPEGSYWFYQPKWFCEEESGIEAGDGKGRIQKQTEM